MRIILILLTIVLFSSCKKDNEVAKTYYHGKISASLYPFLFDNGSYWVYRDTITSNLDSTVVKSITKSTFAIGPSGPGQGSPGDQEYFKISYSSYPTNITYEEQLLGYIISRGLGSGGYTLLSSKQKGDKSVNAEIADILDSIIIEGQTYFNVVKMKITKDSYINNNYNFYYVDSIGVIRKETTNNDSVIDTWNLLRYKTTLFKYQ